MIPLSTSVFSPVDGAVVDLASLRAIADGTDRLLESVLRLRGAPALVLEGLDLDGEWAPAGPPATRRLEGRAPDAVVSPGAALVRTEAGRPLLVELREPVRVPWPTSAGPAVRGVLVLHARTEPARSASGLAVARDEIRVELGFVRAEQADAAPWLLPLAVPVGNGRDWITDVARVLPPEHPAIELLLRRFDQLDQTIWKAEPEGSVWDRQVLGRNWVRYQTVAASALQAARLQLATHALTTQERIRLVSGLFEQLNGSVQRAANELIQSIGRAENAGPYASVVRRGDLE